MKSLLTVGCAPHILSRNSTNVLFFTVLMALVPATIVGCVAYGVNAVFIILIAISSTVAFELVYNLIFKKPLFTDISSIVTGLMIGLLCPANIPLWAPIIAGFFAIVFVKMLFGGLGKNFANPAGAGMILLFLILLNALDTYYLTPFVNEQSVSSLAFIENHETINLTRTFLGGNIGSIGSVSALALLVGGIILCVIGTATFFVPVCTIASFMLFALIFFGTKMVIPYFLATNIIFIAFFMATDYSTSPNTKTGDSLFGTLVGLVSVVFLKVGMGQLACLMALVLCNFVVPFIDEFLTPRVFGARIGGRK